MSDNLKLEKYPNYQSNAQYTRSPAERSYYRREKGESVATVLEAAATAAGDEFALGLAARMAACSSKSNHFLANDLNNADGECFDGFGNLYGCGSKLCHSCVDKAAKLNRKKAREAITNTKLLRREFLPPGAKKYIVEDERYRFVTLTMPKVSVSCTKTIKVLSYAWELFRKLDFTKTYFGGYVKSIEFTVRSDESYHAHIHLLAISFFLPEKTIKRLWRRCVQKSFVEAGLDWREATKNLKDDEKLNVNLKLVHSERKVVKGKIVNEISHKMLNEICKYVTKSESWEKIPASHLLEIANVKRWSRMFELAGRLKDTARSIKAEKESAKESPAEQEQNNAVLNYLDTKYFTDGEAVAENSENSCDSAQNPPAESEKKIKRENWREIIRVKGLKMYKQILDQQVKAMQRVRRRQLREKFPLATFVDLTGFVWHLPVLEFNEEISAVSI